MVPIEMVREYMKLCQQGNETIPARRELLEHVREGLLKQMDKYRRELERLEYKISRYEAAAETGELIWDESGPADP